MIPPWVNFLLAQIATLLNPLAAILAGVKITAKEHAPYNVEVFSQAAVHDLENVTTGLVPIFNLLQLVYNDVHGIVIGTNVVTPITPPPAGYGGGGGGITAADVWNDTAVYANPSKGYVLSLAETYPQIALQFQRSREPFAPLFDMLATGSNWLAAYPSDLPNPLQANIRRSDTIFTWLQREAPAWVWADAFGNSTFVVAPSTSVPVRSWLFSYSPAEFEEWKNALLPSTVLPTAPVWPGIANVTLGTSVALSTGLTLSEAMDGVLVTITSVPPGTSFFQFDDQTSWRYIGAIAFVSDDAQEEFPQNLGFQAAVYCPRSMTSAAAVKVRTKPGVVGTIQAWIRN
jgi:hypothetical protein